MPSPLEDIARARMGQSVSVYSPARALPSGMANAGTAQRVMGGGGAPQYTAPSGGTSLPQMGRVSGPQMGRCPPRAEVISARKWPHR